jgi:hypothetical protein
MPSPMGLLTGLEPPPFRLPGSYFAVALLFLVTGAALLTWSAPDLAYGSFLSPRVVGVTHLFTLGWITTSIMGALYQLLPVVLGQEIRWQGVARLTLWFHAPGVALFVLGLVTVRPAFTIAGASAVSIGVLLFAVNVGASLRRVRLRDATWWALASAVFFLVGAMVLGGAMAANLAWPYMAAERLVALVTHAHVGLVGWALLVVVGVAQKLLPMFLLSPEATDGRVPVALIGGGTMSLFSLHHAPWSWARWLPALIMVAGMAVFLRQALHFYRSRRRRPLDPGLRLAAAALCLLAVATAMGGVLAVTGITSPTTVVAYIGALVFGVTLFVAAIYYKIVPFLVWYHRFAPQAGRGPVPAVTELYSARLAAIAATAMVVGCLIFLVSIGVGPALGGGLSFGRGLSIAGGVSITVRGGAGLFTLGVVLEAFQMARLSRVVGASGEDS